MEKRCVKRTILSRIFYTYLKCLERTVRIEWQQPEAYEFHNIVGFWHEDSLAMNLILHHLAQKGADVAVLVTADERGEYIQYMLEKCGGTAVRIGYGFCNAGTLKEILKSMQDQRHSTAIAMDGPLGPRHIPKKLTYFLSEKSRTALTGVTLSYSRKITLSNRWDHYRIPLPFSKIKVRFDNYGVISMHEIPKIRVYQEERECSIISDGVLGHTT